METKVYYNKRGRRLSEKPRPYVPKPKKVRSVFTYYKGTVFLCMNGEIVRQYIFDGYYERKQILKEWEIWMRNLYYKRIFHITISSTQYKHKLATLPN